jgi:surface antigen
MARPTSIIVVGALLASCTGDVSQGRNVNDWVLAAYARQQALETNIAGQAGAWSSPSTGHSGTIVPLATLQASDGGYCRRYRETVNDARGQNTFVETACRQPDGTWQGTD